MVNLRTSVVDDLRAQTELNSISRKWGHKNEVMINMQKCAVPSIEHTPTQYGLLSMRSYEFRREEGVIAAKRNAFWVCGIVRYRSNAGTGFLCPHSLKKKR